ncbi:hypothetical protein VTK56DRAFT_9088 [Thermocarpiscus australiensis]
MSAALALRDTHPARAVESGDRARRGSNRPCSGCSGVAFTDARKIFHPPTRAPSQLTLLTALMPMPQPAWHLPTFAIFALLDKASPWVRPKMVMCCKGEHLRSSAPSSRLAADQIRRRPHLPVREWILHHRSILTDSEQWDTGLEVGTQLFGVRDTLLHS